MASGQISLSFLMFLAGVGIPIMAAMNANLGRQIENPMFAVLILCCVGLILAILFVLPAEKPAYASFKNIPSLYYMGGALFILYMASVTYSAPIIGLGNAIFFVLLGQLVSAAIIDHYALLNAHISKMTYKRALGILLMIIGVYLARKEVLA